MIVHRIPIRLFATAFLLSLLCIALPCSPPATAQPTPVLQAEPTEFTYQLAPFDSLLNESIFVFDSLGQSVSIWTYNNSSWLFLDTFAVSPMFTPVVIPFTVIPSGLPNGSYVDTIKVYAEGTDDSLAIPVYLNVGPTDGALVVSPSFINRTITAGDSIDGWSYVIEASGATITFDFSNTHSWLGLPLLLDPLHTPDSVPYTMSAESLPPGYYYDTIGIYSNQVSNSPQYIPVALTVTETDPVDLRFYPQSMNLKLPVDDTVLAVAYVWSSPSNGELFWLSTGASWINVHESVTYLTPDFPEIQVSAIGLAAGTYHDTVFFHTDSLAEPTEWVPISLTVFEGDYTIDAYVYRDSWTIEEGQTWTMWDTLHAWCPEGATVNFTVENLSSWLTFSSYIFPGGLTPGSRTFEIDVAGLAPGTYYDTITVTAPTSTNSQVQIPVSLTVTEVEYDVRVQPTAMDLLLPANTITYLDSLWVYEAMGETVEYMAYNRHPWLVAGDIATVVPQTPSFLLLQFNIDTLPLGTYYDTITIEPAVDCGPGMDCPIFEPVQVQVSLTLTNDSVTVLASPPYLQFDVTQGMIIDTVVNVFESLSLQVPFMTFFSPGSGWVLRLDTNLIYTTPAEFPIRIGPISLAAGVYTDTLIIFDPTDGPISWPPILVPIVITVTDDPSHLVAEPNRFQYTLQPYNTVLGSSIVYHESGLAVPFLATDTWQPHDFLSNISDSIQITPDTLVFRVTSGNWPPGTYVDSILLWPLNDTIFNGYEYIKVELTIPASGPGMDTLILPPTYNTSPCYGLQPVAVGLTKLLHGASIPVKIPEGVTVDSISFDGLLTENWDYTTRVIRPDSGFLHISLANSFGEVIPPGHHKVANIYFTMSGAACAEYTSIVWDTTLMYDQTRNLLFVDSSFNDLPVFFQPSASGSQVAGYWPGDFNGDSAVTLTDLTKMVNYLFLAGPPPCVLNALDVNGSCTGPNITDVTFLVNRLFLGGDPLRCGCLSGLRAAPRAVAGLHLTTSLEKGRTILTLTTPEPLKGVELYVQAGLNGAPEYLTIDPELEIIDGRDGALRHIGILDLDGNAVIPPGTHRLIAFDGVVTVVSAIGSDANHLEVDLAASRPSVVPNQFALFQNYPNPFNPSTEIRFALPISAHVQVTIYNVVGQRIATLVDEIRSAGEHTVIWDGTDGRGQEVATGIYLYRLETEQWTESRKMLLLK